MRALASDEFGSDAGRHDMGFADPLVYESYGDCHTFQVHADQRIALSYPAIVLLCPGDINNGSGIV